MLLTKADKLNRNESTNALRLARTVLDSYVDGAGNALPVSVQLFSALKRVGLEEADQRVLDLLGLAAGTTSAVGAEAGDGEQK